MVCINSGFGSPEDGATSGSGSVQWRHRVIMMVTTLDDQDKKFHTLNLAALLSYVGLLEYSSSSFSILLVGRLP